MTRWGSQVRALYRPIEQLTPDAKLTRTCLTSGSAAHPRFLDPLVQKSSGFEEHAHGPAQISKPQYCHRVDNNKGYVTLPEETQLNVSTILALFLEWAEQHYRNPDGTLRKKLENYRQAMRPVCHLYGAMPAVAFGPRKKAVREPMIKLGWCRKYINRQILRVRRIFTWAVGEEFLPASVVTALEAVDGIRVGHGSMRESEPVKPVPQEMIDAILDLVSEEVAAMIRFQLLTGARPGEVCDLGTCDVDRSGRVWAYRPKDHKTKRLGHNREIWIGPRAQEILLPFLKFDREAYVFSPADAEARRNAQRRERRRTPLTPSQAQRFEIALQRQRRRPPRDKYDTSSYRRAIARA